MAQRAWISSPGVAAALHYDTYHNLFVQVVGRKRFWILPPEEADSLYLYPSLHPGYRQSQLLDVREPTETSLYPASSGIRPIEIDVGVGDGTP